LYSQPYYVGMTGVRESQLPKWRMVSLFATATYVLYMYIGRCDFTD